MDLIMFFVGIGIILFGVLLIPLLEIKKMNEIKRKCENYQLTTAKLIRSESKIGVPDIGKKRYVLVNRGIYSFLDNNNKEHIIYDIWIQNAVFSRRLKSIINIYFDKENSNNYITETEIVTRRDFILNLGSFIAIGIICIFLCSLLFIF